MEIVVRVESAVKAIVSEHEKLPKGRQSVKDRTELKLQARPSWELVRSHALQTRMGNSE